MAWVAGIDEVGYGPMLGPLVVTAALFEVPSAGACLWDLLAPAVARKPRRGRVCVCDSKELHKPGDPSPLERTAAAFWKARDGATEASFLEFVAAHAFGADALDGYPWYRPLPLGLPFASDAREIAGHAASVRKALDKAKARFAGIRSSLADAREFNAGVELAGNKSDYLFEISGRLYRWLWQTTAGPERLDVFVGKQGGRAFYADKLQALFPEAFVMIAEESREISTYMIEGKKKRMRMSFVADAEMKHFPVALASILAKYTREGLMEAFNRWWGERVPGLKPTAGYHGDAGRFLRETEEARREMGIGEGMMVRVR
ncbi:MAG: hypothetical protein FD180_964 [Planctomycetota bacterium]|nr:MAG: hypothetical protein FD180_964 [Planctomycetota bacterium]